MIWHRLIEWESGGSDESRGPLEGKEECVTVWDKKLLLVCTWVLDVSWQHTNNSVIVSVFCPLCLSSQGDHKLVR